MPFHISPENHSRRRCRQLQHTQSCQTSPTQKGLDGTVDYHSVTRSYQSSRRSSFRLPGKVSQALLSKIRKFEALDALSVPFKVKHPALKPAPLHVIHTTRLSPKQRIETEVDRRKQLPTIFSPLVRAREETRVLSASELTHEQTDIFESFDIVKLQASLERVKARIADTTIEVSYKPHSIQLRDRAQDRNHSPHDKLVRRSEISHQLKELHYPTSPQLVSLTDRRGSFSQVITHSPKPPKMHVEEIVVPSKEEYRETPHKTKEVIENRTLISRAQTPPIPKDKMVEGYGVIRDRGHAQHVRYAGKHTFISGPSTPPSPQKDIGSLAIITQNQSHNQHFKKHGGETTLISRAMIQSPEEKSGKKYTIITRDRAHAQHVKVVKRPTKAHTEAVEASCGCPHEFADSRDAIILDESRFTNGKGLERNSASGKLLREHDTRKRKILSLQDRINYFDGAMSQGTNTHARPSLIASVTPTTSTNQRPSITSHIKTTNSGGYMRRMATASRIPEPVTPTRPGHSPTQSPLNKKQNLIFGSPVRNPFLASPTLDSKTSSIVEFSPVSPRTVSRIELGRSVNFHNQGLPHVNEIWLSTNCNNNTSSETICRLVARENREQLVRAISKEECAGTLDKGKIGEKIEKLYQAKNLERRQETLEHSIRPPLFNIASILQTSQKIATQPAVLCNREKTAATQRSKVAKMKRIFDGGSTSKNFGTVGETKLLNLGNVALRLDQRSVMLEDHPSTRMSALIPLAPIVPNIRTPETINELSISTVTELIPQTEEITTRVPFLSKHTSPLNGKSICDRLKLFEGGPGKEQLMSPATERLRRILRRKINKSLKNLFEPSPPQRRQDERYKAKEITEILRNGNEGWTNGRKLSANDGEDAVDEFQEEPPARIEQTRTLAKQCEWGKDGTHSETAYSLSSIELGDEEIDMIVKEAECGLNHPKPLRLAEMTRMMALCREKVGMGNFRYRDKGHTIG